MRLIDKEPRPEDYELHGLGGEINTSPLQQLTLPQVESFFPHLLERPTLPDAWCDSLTGHHLLVHDFDIICCNFVYYVIGPEASRCVFFKLGVVTVLHLKKNEMFE